MRAMKIYIYIITAIVLLCGSAHAAQRVVIVTDPGGGGIAAFIAGNIDIDPGNIIHLDVNGNVRVDQSIEKHSPNAIVAVGPQSLYSVQHKMKTPIVHCMVYNSVDYRDRDNITGINRTIPPETQIEVFKKAVPGLKRLGIVHSAETEDWINEARLTRDIKIISNKIESKKEAAAAFLDLRGRLLGKNDAILLLPDRGVYSDELETFLLGGSFQNEIPLVSTQGLPGSIGAIVTIEIDVESTSLQIAGIVNEILEGKPVGEIPGQTAKYNVELNHQIAGKIGITLEDDKRIVGGNTDKGVNR